MVASVLFSALLAAHGSSHLSASRIARASAPAPLVDITNQQEALPACLEKAMNLRGGSTQTCDVVLVGCGVPKRGMGWYHAKQMLDGDVPSAKLTSVVEPWFLGAGADSPPGEAFKAWADEMEAAHGTKFCKDVSDLDIQVRAPPRNPFPRACPSSSRGGIGARAAAAAARRGGAAATLPTPPPSIFFFLLHAPTRHSQPDARRG